MNAAAPRDRSFGGPPPEEQSDREQSEPVESQQAERLGGPAAQAGEETGTRVRETGHVLDLQPARRVALEPRLLSPHPARHRRIAEPCEELPDLARLHLLGREA